MHPITKALHVRADINGACPAVTPLFQNSGFEAGSPYFYSRKNNPNVAELEEVIGGLENAKHCLAVTTGMSSLAMTLDLLNAGDLLVVNKHVYGCSFALFQRLARRRGFTLDVRDLSNDAEVQSTPVQARMVLFETPTNPFLKTIDIKRVSTVVKANNPNALIVVDNTWATPIFQHPLEHGADLSLHSATKYISGHTDVMGGFILADRDDLAIDLRDSRFYTGANLDPHSAWLLRRSVQTLGLRMKHHTETTNQLIGFLRELPQVAQVYAPHVDGKQLKGCGGIIFFSLRADLGDKFGKLQEALQLFETGTGMACVTSMVAQPYNGSHASMSADEKAKMGLGPDLVRLCFGLEDIDDLKADLRAGLASLEAKGR